MITQYSNFKYGTTQVSKIYQGTTLVWPPEEEWTYYTPTPIDLGLSVKWASFNLGASRPEEYGYRYAWGETVPKKSFTWENYKWCRGTDTTLTKYNVNSSYGTVDNKTVLNLSDDAARVNLGGTWRIPTSQEWQELINNCTWTWINGITWSSGMLVTSNVSGYTNKSIFLPAEQEPDRQRGKMDYLWSSTLVTNPPTSAYAVYYRYVYSEYDSDWIYSKNLNINTRALGVYSSYWDISYGTGIRPVCS